jgi:mannose-6-phosphate isomerase-like protein (cupin superfamily)
VNEVAITGPTGGENVDLQHARIRILEDGSHTGHRIGIAEIIIPPHTPGPPQHRHALHDEGFYIVSGSGLFTVGTTEHEATAGTLVMVPTGAPHTFANPGDVPLVMVNTFTPDLYVQYFRDLRTMVEATGPLTPESTLEVMARYATEPATDYAGAPSSSA